MKTTALLLPAVLAAAGVRAQNTVPTDADYCSLSGSSIAIVNRKAYIYGGWQTYGREQPDDSMVNYQGPNDFIRTVSLRTSFNTSHAIDTYVNRTRLPDDVPRMTHAAWWPVNDTSLELMLGVQETSEHMIDSDTAPARLLSNQRWGYNILTGAWSKAGTTLKGWKTGPGTAAADVSPDSALKAWMPALRRGFYINGINSADGVKLSSKVPKSDGFHNGMLVYNASISTWVNRTAPYPDVGDAPLTALPTATDHVLVMFGGQAKVGTRAMGTVKIYSTSRGKWYTYTARSGSSVPPPRTSFCTALLSAPDNSSHAILVFGGQSTPLANVADNVMVVDTSIWAFMLPAMVWIPLSTSTSSAGVRTPDSKLDATCIPLGPRSPFVLVHGGQSKPTSAGGNITCDGGGRTLYLFNAATLQWTDVFTPSETYTVPAAFRAVVGGTAVGGADVTTPEGGWGDQKELGRVLSFARDGDSIGSLSPITEDSTASTPLGGIIGGVVGGVIALALLGAGFWFWRRRRARRGAALATGTGIGGVGEIDGKEMVGWPRVEMEGDRAAPRVEMEGDRAAVEMAAGHGVAPQELPGDVPRGGGVGGAGIMGAGMKGEREREAEAEDIGRRRSGSGSFSSREERRSSERLRDGR
ncbi:hypothetical protein EDC01DRAFT_733001 [Geopyxis carbonaria]|nr:hypothetical protein EDC01DRAFT_733001 [Geopyxis carbonaria]